MGGSVGRRLVIVVAAIVALAGAGGSVRADPVSHRALYSMTLLSTSRASDIAELGGRMLVEIVDVCDGWTLDQRIALAIANSDGDDFRSYTSFTSWESKDGKRFRFEQKTRHDDVTIDELGGRAEITAAGGGAATLTKPEAATIALPPGAVFPNQHTAMLIARAEAGETFFTSIVFDGTSIDNPSYVSAFIGTPTTAPRLAGEAQAPSVWPVRLAFFQLAARSPEPDIEIGLLLQSNGIARAVELDYGGFAIEGRLEELELLEPLDC